MIQQRNQMLFFKRKYMCDKAQAFQLLVDFPSQQTNPLILMWLLKNLSKIKVITFLQCYEFCEKAIITFCVILPIREKFDAPSILRLLSGPSDDLEDITILRILDLQGSNARSLELRRHLFWCLVPSEAPFLLLGTIMFPPAHRL